MNQPVDIVLGCSYGDEGKGKVVYDLLKRNNYNLCVRFNGSANAGHTIYENNTKFVVHQLPIGMLLPNVYNLMSSDCLIDVEKLKKELKELNNKGIDTKGRLIISKACHIITKDCIDYDKNNNKIGTTGSGIGPTYSKKMLRTGKRVEDIVDELGELNIMVVDMRKFWHSDFMKERINKIILEGAQGFGLDINWTATYPYCTSSTCTIAGAINTGIPLSSIKNIYGITKIYDTYVGTMPFQPLEHSKELELIGKTGHEFGATTERKRQCNFLNLDNLIDALKINSCTTCIINKVDIAEAVNIFKLYYKNELIIFNSMNEMKHFINDKLSFVPEIIYSGNPNAI